MAFTKVDVEPVFDLFFTSPFVNACSLGAENKQGCAYCLGMTCFNLRVKYEMSATDAENSNTT